MVKTLDLVREHWTRGEPGRQGSPALIARLYRLWVLAFAFKLLGATWDICWHFKWLRDDLAPPHLINTVGTVIVLGLVIVHTYTGIGVDRTTLRWMQWGTGVFLVAAPLDVINHRVNGLDITAWSSSHALLYIGTGMMIVGVLRGWTALGGADRLAYPITCFLWFAVLDGFLFLNQHQEYGVLGLEAWARGEPYAEPSLLQFAAQDLGRPVDWIAVENFTLPVPDWVYPTWATATGMITLVLARRLTGGRWTATWVAGGYVAFRCVAWVLLAAADFPVSTVPFFILGGAVAVDLVFNSLLHPPVVKALAGSVIVTAATYVSLLVQATFVKAPPVSYSSAAFAVVALAALWSAAAFVLDHERGREWWRRTSARFHFDQDTAAGTTRLPG